MSYENAPATAMVATLCACCSKELVDAISVETGVGPICRRKHGYEDAQGPADWARVLQITDGVVAVAEIASWNGDAHKAANVLVHRIACEQDGADVLVLTDAIAALGYEKLAERIRSRLVAVTVMLELDQWVVSAPYCDGATVSFRRIPGRRWDRERKVNRFPRRAGREVLGALRQHFAGMTAYGRKGLFTL